TGGRSSTERSPSASSVAEADPQIARGFERVVVQGDGAHAARLDQTHGLEAGRSETDHDPELPALHQANRGRAEASGDGPVARRRPAAALEMAEHERACLLPRHFREAGREQLPHAAEALLLTRFGRL